MRKALWLLTGCLLMISVVFGISLLLPSKVTVSKSIHINASQTAVASQIENFNNWNRWYSFSDKNVSIVADKKRDSFYCSATLHDEKGRNIIITLLPSSADTISVSLKAKDKKTLNYQFILLADSKGYTLLVWNTNFNLGWYPWQRLQGLVMDKMMGDQYLSALENLKKAVETSNADSRLNKF